MFRIFTRHAHAGATHDAIAGQTTQARAHTGSQTTPDYPAGGSESPGRRARLRHAGRAMRDKLFGMLPGVGGKAAKKQPLPVAAENRGILRTIEIVQTVEHFPVARQAEVCDTAHAVETPPARPAADLEQQMLGYDLALALHEAERADGFTADTKDRN